MTVTVVPFNYIEILLFTNIQNIFFCLVYNIELTLFGRFESNGAVLSINCRVIFVESYRIIVVCHTLDR